MSCRTLARIYLALPNRITSYFFVRCVTKREERWKKGTDSAESEEED